MTPGCLDFPVQREIGAEPSALARALAKHARAPGHALPLRGFGLAARVLAVTIGFVLLAMSLFYVTQLVAHREMWLHNKVTAAQTIVEAFGLAGPAPPAQDLSQKILNSVEAKSIVVDTPAGRREFIAAGGAPAGARRSQPTTAPMSTESQRRFMQCSTRSGRS